MSRRARVSSKATQNWRRSTFNARPPGARSVFVRAWRAHSGKQGREPSSRPRSGSGPYAVSAPARRRRASLNRRGYRTFVGAPQGSQQKCGTPSLVVPTHTAHPRTFPAVVLSSCVPLARASTASFLAQKKNAGTCRRVSERALKDDLRIATSSAVRPERMVYIFWTPQRKESIANPVPLRAR